MRSGARRWSQSCRRRVPLPVALLALFSLAPTSHRAGGCRARCCARMLGVGGRAQDRRRDGDRPTAPARIRSRRAWAVGRTHPARALARGRADRGREQAERERAAVGRGARPDRARAARHRGPPREHDRDPGRVRADRPRTSPSAAREGSARSATGRQALAELRRLLGCCTPTEPSARRSAPARTGPARRAGRRRQRRRAERRAARGRDCRHFPRSVDLAAFRIVAGGADERAAPRGAAADVRRRRDGRPSCRGANALRPTRRPRGRLGTVWRGCASGCGVRRELAPARRRRVRGRACCRSTRARVTSVLVATTRSSCATGLGRPRRPGDRGGRRGGGRRARRCAGHGGCGPTSC